jgi:hypothetical protein
MSGNKLSPNEAQELARLSERARQEGR